MRQEIERQNSRSNLRRPVSRMLAAIFTILLAFGGGMLLRDRYGERVSPNVMAAGIPVGGMTRAEVRQVLREAADRFSREDMVVCLQEEELHLSPDTTGVKLQVEKAVRTVFDRSRSGQGGDIGLLSCMRLDTQAIDLALEEYAKTYNTDYCEASYTLEGPKPNLEEGACEKASRGQTLLLTMGEPQRRLHVQEIFDRVMDAYDRGCLRTEVEISPEEVPELPDLEGILRQVGSDPVDASLDFETFQRRPAVYGYGFDLENARKLIKEAGYGETVAIPMETIPPEILGDDVYFRDVLGEYNSGHSNRVNIVNNLQLVCGFLDGIVIQPGEVFSYNDAVGERTVERGFLYGESFTGFLESRSAGGGVCQGSSVLYVCALTAELEIVERVNHGMEVNYTPPGQDAAVSWGGPDFRFRNNTHFPIRISARLEENQMRIQLLGTDEKDYYIKLESTYGHDSLQSYANVYMCKYDKQTDALLSREKVSHSAYRLLT